MKCLACTLMDIHVQRCGVIPYVIKDGILYFLLGEDTRTGDFTDFGGGVKKNEPSLKGGWREFIEESLGIFDTKINDMTLDLVIYTHNMGIIFHPVDESYLYVKTTEKTREISSVRWFTIDEIFTKTFYFKRTMEVRLWRRLANFFKKTLDTPSIHILHALYDQRFPYKAIKK